MTEKAQLLGIDDKNGINACKLLGLAFTTLRCMKNTRYKDSVIEDARLKLEANP